MGSDARRYAADESYPEGYGFSENRGAVERDVAENAPAGKYQYQAPSADDVRRVLEAAQRGGDLFFFASVAWDLGNDLIEREDFDQAGYCFGRMLRAAEALEDDTLAELSRVAGGLCAALGREPESEELRLARKRLSRGLFHVDDEDVGFVKDVLETRGRTRAAVPGSPCETPAGLPGAILSEVRPLPQRSDERPDVSQEEEPEVPVEPRRGLWVRFFGRFEVFCAGEPVDVGRNGKALAILKYLLAHRSRPVPQDYLMDWLWPDSGLKKAKWSLNSAVYALRRSLEAYPLPSGVAVADCVLLEAGYYRLCPELEVSSDREEFDERYERGRRLEKLQRTEEAMTEYERAVELYRGDYLTEDLYEDWTMIERERLANAYVDMLDHLAGFYLETGQLRKSVGCSYRLLQEDRCHENGYRLLMRCYARLGLRTRALGQYELCERALKQQYGMTPSQETRELHQRLLTGEDI